MLERGLVAFTIGAGLFSRGSCPEGRLSYILLALVGAAVFFMAAGTNQVFADSALQHAPDAPAASLGGQTYSRQVTDSVSVASQFDNPASRNFASRTFARGISDGVGVASEFGGPAGQTSTSQARTFGPQQPTGQRIDSGQRLMLGNNKIDNRLYGAGAVAQTGTPVAEVATMGEGEMDFTELATLGDGEDSDSNRLLQVVTDVSSTSSAMQGMVVYTNAVSGVYLFAVIAMVINKSPAFAREKRKTVDLGAGRVLVISTRDPSRGRLMVIVIAAVATASVMSFAGPVVGEAFADTNRAAIAYRSTAGSDGVDDPKYREWDPVNLQWTSELVIDKSNTSPITHAWLEFSPASTKRVIITYSGLSGTGDGGLDSYVCYSACLDSNSWIFTNNFAVLPVYAAPADQRPFDIEYEHTSGDLLVVYDYTESGSSNANDLFYRIMTDSQTSFGSESAINDTNNADTAAIYSFIRLASRKTSGSDQLALIAIDSTNSDAVAIRWNGSAWVTTAGQQTELTATVSITTEEAIDIAYETNSGDILIVAGEGISIRHNTYNAGTGTWGSSSTSTGSWGVGVINWLQLVPNPTSSSNQIFLIGSGSSSDLDSAYWGGSTWTDHAEHDSDIDTNSNRNFDFAWETGTSAGLMVWGAASGSISFKRFTAPNTFASGTFADDGTHTVMSFASNPTTTDTVAALGLAIDSSDDISGIRWDGGSNNPAATTNDDITLVSSDARRPFSIDFQKIPAVPRSVSQTITFSDSISAVKIKNALVAQNLTVSDSVTRVLVASPSIAENMTVADSLARAIVSIRSTSNSVTITDDVTRATVFARSLSDTVMMADLADPTIIVTRATSDSLPVSDNIVRTAAHTRTIAEAVIIADSIARMIAIAGAMSDIILVIETHARTYAASRSMVDAVSIIDTTARIVAFVRSISDPIAVYELAGRNNLNARLLADSLTVAETVVANVALNVPVSDSLAVIDLIATETSASRSATEILAVTDSAGRLVLFARAIAELVAITEDPAAKAASSRLVAESLPVADSIVTTVSAARSASDTIAITDTAGHAVFASRQISDSLPVTDVTSAQVSVRTVSDVVRVSDAITARITVVSISDTLTATDLVSAKVTARSASDQVAITDTVTAKIGSRSIAEFVAFADSLYARVTGRSASDAVTVADGIKAMVNFHLADSITVVDAIATSVTRSIVDSVTIADAAARAYTTSRPVSEWLSIADLVSTSLVYARTMSDALAVTDNITRSLTSARAIADSLSATDAVGTAVLYARSFADAVTVADVATRSNLARGSASEALTVTDEANRSLAVSRSAGETLSITDSIARKVMFGRYVADSAAMTDTTSVALAISRFAVDSVAVTDNASAKLVVQRAITDGISPTDSVSAKTQTKREIADMLSLSDNVAQSANYGLADAILMSDQMDVSLRPVSNVADQLTFQDKVNMSVTRAISDSLALLDAARQTSLNVTIMDSLSVTEQPRIVSLTIRVADSLGIADSARPISLAVNIADSLAVADQTRIGSMAVNISDALAVTDASRLMSLSLNIAESLTITDRARSFEPLRTIDLVTVADAISIHVNRILADAVSVSDIVDVVAGDQFAASITDSLAIADTMAIASGKLVSINDLLTVGAALTDVSAHLNLNFGEEFVLGECSPFACNLVWHGYEDLELATEISPPTAPVDVLRVIDSIVRRLIGSSVPNLGDSVSFSDSVSARITSILVVDKKENAGPLTSTPIIGNFTYTGNPSDLKAQIQPMPIPINSTVVRPDLPRYVTILRTFHVPIIPNAAIPGDDAIVTETQKEVLALSNMFMRLNFKETPQLNEHNFIQTLDIEFTPKVDSTNFGLVVTVLDAPPGIAPLPVEELRPIYVDVRWVGNFPSIENPAVQTYYQNLPKFTFTVNGEWVRDQDASRDSNGIPNLKLWLLDESTNQWTQITSITKPTAESNGTYTFVATLPHFSDYAITATKAPRPSGGSQGGNPSPGSLPPVAGTALVVNLLESLTVDDSQDSVPIEVIEEFGEKKLTVQIADAIAIITKPVSYRTFHVGDVEVRITVQEVRQESLIPPKATATFLIEMDNLGGKEEEFTLNFWYYDQSGNRPYESSQVAAIGPNESRKLLVDVPFTEPGVFEVTAEARSIPGGDLVNTAQLTVTIPWLVINLYVLVVVAVAILAASGGVMAVLLRGGLAGAGAGAGTALFLLARKRKPTIRVTDRLASVEDEYDIVVEVRQREGEGDQATFDLEIVNRSGKTHEFMLKYWAADSSGIRMSEHVERVRIKGRTTDVRVAQVSLPPGRNIFAAEAGPISEKQARWSHAGVRVKSD